jgi:serine/threonine-protein kinase RsbW
MAYLMENNFDSVQLMLPSKAEYVSTARLVVSSIANKIGFNIDEIEDIKVAVLEVCSNFVKKTSESCNIIITFNVQESTLDISFKCPCFSGKIFADEDEALATAIITALMDSVEFQQDSEAIISMRKSIGEKI